MTALVIAPHPDDEAIGCGGAILRHAGRGEAVHVAFLSSGELALGGLERADAWERRESEARAAAEVLGVASLSFLRKPDWFVEEHVAAATAEIAGIVETRSAGLVYVPHAAEWHPDHRAAYEIGLAAADRCGLAAFSVLRYEVWTPLPAFDVIEDVTDVFERKLAAIGCYASQLSQFDYVQAASGLAQYRGALAAKTTYAEVFDRCSDEDVLAVRDRAAARVTGGVA